MRFGQRLLEAIRRAGTPLVVGIDPRPASYPPALVKQTLKQAQTAREARLAPARALAFALLELAAAERVAVIKPNVAFFEALGPEGMALYAELLAAARAAGLLVIADVKRADIGSTSRAYAEAYFGPEAPFRADAITVQPWLGADAMAPLLEAAQADAAGLFWLVRTSNPGAAAIQDLAVCARREQAPAQTPCEALHEHVAAMLEAQNRACMTAQDRYGPIGAVVGATVPDTVARLRRLMPSAILLAPGVGSQGASVALLRPAFDARGEGALIPVSRAIAQAWREMPPEVAWQDAIRHKIRSLRNELRHVLGR